MNDFFKAMSQFGMENIISGEHTMTLEEEMNSEIAMEVEIDEAHYQMDCANILASTSQCEAILSAMAEREIGLECNDGRDPSVIYSEFGLEAVKDVAMRKVYSGVASLKALINTCINWLKQLLGLTTASKKIFNGLFRKSKAMYKQLMKVQPKVSDKLTRDIPDYSKAFQELFKEFRDKLSDGAISEGNKLAYLSLNVRTLEKTAQDRKYQAKTVKDSLDKLDDIYDKDDTNDYEGSECFNKISTMISDLKTLAEKAKGLNDMEKNFDKKIKSLEKFRKDIEKDDQIDAAKTNAISKYINGEIELATAKQRYAKKSLRLFVRCADDCLTMAKGVYATLV